MRLAAKVGLAAAAGMAVIQAGPGITGLGPVRLPLFPRLSGRGLPDHVALTFDDGPDRAVTPLFLRELQSRGLQCTFFLVGSRVSANPGLAAELAAAGHEIGVHGWTHRYLPLRGPRAAYDDLARAQEIIASATGTVPQLFRPPYGVLSGPALVAARRLGLVPVLWTNWGKEWTPGATPESVFATLTAGLRGGATVLLHDSESTSPAGSAKAALGALPLLLDECQRRNLRVGPLREHGMPWSAAAGREAPPASPAAGREPPPASPAAGRQAPPASPAS